MKQSEFKKQLEEKERRDGEACKKFWQEFNEKPKIYTNMICENITYNIGGRDTNGAFGMCWYCPNCGRRGINTQKDSLRKIDSLIEEKCDLEVG